MSSPKVLLYDIETAPVLAYVWGIWDQTVGINQIKDDWHLLSWAAKWLGEPPHKVKYMDQSRSKKISDDKPILEGIWKLLNEADIVITQNGKQFDEKKLNARFIINGLKPPKPYKHIDTKQLAKNKFGFTSNSLEYMSSKICKKYKKLKHEKFSGFELWSQCLAGNKEAWAEMKKYNIYDVLSLEELYLALQAWDTSINFNLYKDHKDHSCNCGNKNIVKEGFAYTSSSKYQIYSCKACGSWTRGKTNLFTAKERANLRVGVR